MFSFIKKFKFQKCFSKDKDSPPANPDALNSPEETEAQLQYCARMTKTLLDCSGLSIDDMYDFEGAVLATYAFGMISAYSMEHSLPQNETANFTISILMTVFGYEYSQAVSRLQELINSTRREYHPTMYAIIHRGINGYIMYKENHIKKLMQDINELLTIFLEEFSK